MAEEIHHFHVESLWSGLSSGNGAIKSTGYEIPYGMPEQTGGTAGRCNPEEMLLGAVSSCYSIVFSILSERRRLPLSGIQIAVEGDVERQPGGTLKFLAIRLKPRITLTGADESQLAAARDFAQKAELYCPISNALRGNVEISVEPELVNT